MTAALTGLARELLEKNVVGVGYDEDTHNRGDVDQKADEEATADKAGPSASLCHHPVMDGIGIERVGRRGRAGGSRGTAKYVVNPERCVVVQRTVASTKTTVWTYSSLLLLLLLLLMMMMMMMITGG